MGEIDSLLQSVKECYISGRTDHLEKHHVYSGSRRKAADKWGCWVWLNHDYHTGAYGIQYNAIESLKLKQACQRAFEQLYGHERFMDVFGKNYLED